MLFDVFGYIMIILGLFSLGEFIYLLLRFYFMVRFRILRSVVFLGIGDWFYLEKFFGYLLEYEGIFCNYKVE